jgi:hypothetical protein
MTNAMSCSSATQEHALDLARHFKTDPTETVALCFGYAKTPCLRAEDKLSSEQMNRPIVYYSFQQTIHDCQMKYLQVFFVVFAT